MIYLFNKVAKVNNYADGDRFKIKSIKKFMILTISEDY